MSSVFGIMTVQRVEIDKEGIVLHCYDAEYKDWYKVHSNKILSIDTKLYWEFDCRTSKMSFAVIQ